LLLTLARRGDELLGLYAFLLVVKHFLWLILKKTWKIIVLTGMLSGIAFAVTATFIFLVGASLLWGVPWPTPSLIMLIVLSLTSGWFVFFVVYEYSHT
jgi:hypothetical protein